MATLMPSPSLGPITLSHAQVAIEVAATLAFAASGLLEGARKRLDAVGLFVVTGLTAFGGGTLRDVLLDRRPFFWVDHAHWLWALILLIGACMLFLRKRHFELTERAMLWPDALGLGLFAASGTHIALQAQMPAIVAVLMGMMTAAFGGVLRDIVCNEIPRCFRDHQPYAVLAFVGGWLLVLLDQLNCPDWLALTLSASTIVALRAMALWRQWRLPAWPV